MLFGNNLMSHSLRHAVAAGGAEVDLVDKGSDMDVGKRSTVRPLRVVSLSFAFDFAPLSPCGAMIRVVRGMLGGVGMMGGRMNHLTSLVIVAHVFALHSSAVSRRSATIIMLIPRDKECTVIMTERSASRWIILCTSLSPPFPTIHLPTVTGSLRGFMMGWEGVRR